MTFLAAITQRVEIDPRHGERRDALDQRWPVFLAACGIAPLLLPNHPATARALLNLHQPAGLILTGGNDLMAYGGNAPERDDTELEAIAWMRRAHKPVIGICRGLQMLTDTLGGTLKRIDGHAGTRHPVRVGNTEVELNSYHAWAIDRLPDQCTAFAIAHDGSVEGWRHHHEPLGGIMWHPERESSYSKRDIDLIRTMLFVP